MILMTLGTISFPFDRAILWLKILLDRGVITEPVFLQYGASDISALAEHPLVTVESTVTLEKLIKLADNSRLVISHAGQGSTRMLASRKVPFVLIPRLKLYGEHVDDHQRWFAEAVAPRGIQNFVDLDELEKAILQPPPRFQGQLFSNPKLTDYLMRQYPPEESVSLMS
ncbi:glycosyltransferase [Calothrix sp. PCC 7507]|uniref:glycosyltransferase n=1 Tax=Calothrix sp. PCC 7507 TaxID=99598 RepID=UPI00029F012D|nr:glycosyltransferase [Calothrix sp. PCC 7507]AFY32494.1 Glycosyltransferase 28 domain protein [Calothrix sp. PCC 7507]